MQANKTRRQLVYATLSLISPAAGQVPSAEDISAIDAYVDPMVTELAAKDVVFVDDPGVIGPDDGAIDAALFLSLCRWLANVCGPEFGTPFDQNIQDAAEHNMRNTVAARPTFEPMTAEYF